MNAQNNAIATAPAQTLPPEAFLSNIAFGALMTQALAVAAELKIADALAERPQSIAELAAATGTHERALYRILRSLASIGIFTETETQVFANTPYSEPLRSDAPNSMRNGAIFMGADWHWKVWGDTLYSVKTGKPAWGQAHGEEVFNYFSENPEHAAIFNDAMTDMSMGTATPVVEAYDFSGIETLADIAGGHGYLLAQILKTNENLKGVLFDMPQVIEGAPALLEREAVKDRVETVAGDFFASVPSADAYIMKHIIHDWDDERCVTILKNIHAAMNGDGKLLIVEAVVPEGNEPHYSKLLDLEMLVSPGGAERTAEEYRELLASAGFELTRIVPTKSPFSIVEAVKAK
jgi:hypothetical protein